MGEGIKALTSSSNCQTMSVSDTNTPIKCRSYTSNVSLLNHNFGKMILTKKHNYECETKNLGQF